MQIEIAQSRSCFNLELKVTIVGLRKDEDLLSNTGFHLLESFNRDNCRFCRIKSVLEFLYVAQDHS